jgi:hypothetical protein
LEKRSEYLLKACMVKARGLVAPSKLKTYIPRMLHTKLDLSKFSMFLTVVRGRLKCRENNMLAFELGT